MSKALDTFDKWWMMQSKIPYRDKKEIARSAWEQSRTATLDEVKVEISKVFDVSDYYESTAFDAGIHSAIKAIDNLRGKSDGMD